jgi:DNA-binding response OmpR family regulator
VSYPLSGRRVLVAEDLWLVAIAICDTIELCGGHVVGPFPTNAACEAALDAQEVDAAILDIGLDDGAVFPVARKLRQKGIPFLFLTGYGSDMVPAEFATEIHLLKPWSSRHLCANVARLMPGPNTPASHSDAPGSL